MTMSLLLADDQESAQETELVASDGFVESDGLIDVTALDSGDEITQVLRDGEEDGQSTVYGSSCSPLGECSQRPSAMDMTTIYPTAVDGYHQPTVRNRTSSNNNNNSSSNSSASTQGVEPPSTNDLLMGQSSTGVIP